jgi:HTH-type transcriptional regulator / antitoxin HipB
VRGPVTVIGDRLQVAVHVRVEVLPALAVIDASRYDVPEVGNHAGADEELPFGVVIDAPRIAEPVRHDLEDRPARARDAQKELKTYTLADMKDKYIGNVGTQERDEYEHELRMDVLGKMIKRARQERNLTQEELGRLVGVQKAQISKLERSANSATIDTILKVFKALKAEINFNVKLEDNFLKLS